MNSDAKKWLRVTRSSPCRICGKPDWCTVTIDGSACCMRVESQRAMANGGWLHASDANPANWTPPPKRQEAPEIDAAYLISRWQRETAPDLFTTLASSLGLTESAVRSLSPAWAREHRAWAFPMRDGQGGIVGIRLRNDAGEKWAVRGSRSGIFVPAITPQDVALICEGPTDTAAAVAMGFFAIGRASCNTGSSEVSATCLRLGIRRVVVVSDNDAPGIRGANELAAKLDLPHKILIPPTKDIRKLYAAGGRRDFVEAQLQSLVWKGCKNGR